MKTFFVLGLFLFLAVGLDAQSLKFIKSGNSVMVKNENSDSRFQPYEDKGSLTWYEIKDTKRQKEWSAQLKNDVLSEDINEKIKAATGYIAVTFYFNGEGDVVDATFYISNAIHENLTETEIRSIFNRLMNVKMDMGMLSWEGSFNFSSYSIFLKRSKSAR